MAKIFIGSTRVLKWKNLERLKRAFAEAAAQDPSLVLDLENCPPPLFAQKLKDCYGVILVSLGDISPNLILEAIRAGKPFILTTENGLESRLAGIGRRSDPENQAEMTAQILELSRPAVYQAEKDKLASFNFKHGWSQIAEEFLGLASKV
jgi:glycosyltransferase involved in cell wall biosynthesis